MTSATVHASLPFPWPASSLRERCIDLPVPISNEMVAAKKEEDYAQLKLQLRRLEEKEMIQKKIDLKKKEIAEQLQKEKEIDAKLQMTTSEQILYDKQKRMKAF